MLAVTKSIKVLKIVVLVLILSLISSFILTGSVFADQSPAQKAVCESLGGPCDEADGSGIDSVVGAALNILSLVAGVIAVIMIIIAGLKFMTSQGDASKVAGARNSVIYAVIGIVIVVMAQIIVQFVIKQTEPTPVDESSITLPVVSGYGINVSELIEKKEI